MNKILSFAIGPIGSAILGIISLPILAWYFSPEDIGRISILQIAISFCVLLFSLGLDQSYVREYHESKNKPLLFKAAVLPGLILLICISLLVMCIEPYLISNFLFSIADIKFSLLVVLAIISSFIIRFFSLILRMEERGLSFSIIQLLPKLLFVSIVLLYVAVQFSYNFSNLLMAQLLSLLTTFLLFGGFTKNIWLASFKLKVDYKKLKHMLKFGLPLIAGGAATWALMFMDQIALKYWSSLSELGVYSIALKLGSTVAILGAIFNTLWSPTVYKWAAGGDNLDKVKVASEYVQFFVLLAFIAVVLSCLVPKFLPDEYEKIDLLLPLVIASPLFYTLSETTSIGIGLKRKTLYAFIASFFAAIINLVGNYLLVPTYGAIGAAISTAITMWLFLIFRTEFSARIWQRTAGKRMFSFTFLMVVLGGVSALQQQNNVSYYVVALIFVLYAYKKEILNMVSWYYEKT